eukprot:TRINITY_DN740_c0_g1_i1.p1 TRINITY_DN740_c0_g1~~TRINITY_DN740_c0_g1_i1.p1  ORF type:complete len:2364 (+),score=263.90 TRINITY_DN740_c0_g1_i1:1645-8736(+)
MTSLSLPNPHRLPRTQKVKTRMRTRRKRRTEGCPTPRRRFPTQSPFCAVLLIRRVYIPSPSSTQLNALNSSKLSILQVQAGGPVVPPPREMEKHAPPLGENDSAEPAGSVFDIPPMVIPSLPSTAGESTRGTGGEGMLRITSSRLSMERALLHSSVFIFSGENRLRKFLFRIIQHPKFEVSVAALILINCIFLALDNPAIPDSERTSQLRFALTFSDYFFAAAFSLEVLTKIIALGFVLHRGAYLRSAWNVFDFVVVGLSVIGLWSTVGNYGAFRTLRVLRPLRSVNGIPGLRNIVNAVFRSFVGLANVLALATCVVLFLGILGVQLWAGTLHAQCIDSQGNVQSNGKSTVASCKNTTFSSRFSLFGKRCPAELTCAVTGNPDYGYTSFDNVLWAMLVIFECITLSGWTDVMYGVQAAWSELSAIYFIILVVVGNFIIINLSLAVLTYNFENAPVAGTLSRMPTLAPMRAQSPSEFFTPLPALSRWYHIIFSKCRNASRSIVGSVIFNGLIVVLIVGNTLLLCAEHYQQPEALDYALSVVNIIVYTVFVIEMLLKMMAKGVRKYLHDYFHLLDVFVIVTSTAEFITRDRGKGGTAFRALRLVRLFKLLKTFESVRELLRIILRACSYTGYLNLMIFMYLFLAALVGMQFFGGKFNFPDGRPRATFDGIYWAFLTAFQILTFDNWPNVMWDGMRATGPGAAVFFVLMVILGDFVFLNLFLAILIKGFTDIHLQKEIGPGFQSSFRRPSTSIDWKSDVTWGESDSDSDYPPRHVVRAEAPIKLAGDIPTAPSTLTSKRQSSAGLTGAAETASTETWARKVSHTGFSDSASRVASDSTISKARKPQFSDTPSILLAEQPALISVNSMSPRASRANLGVVPPGGTKTQEIDRTKGRSGHGLGISLGIVDGQPVLRAPPKGDKSPSAPALKAKTKLNAVLAIQRTQRALAASPPRSDDSPASLPNLRKEKSRLECRPTTGNAAIQNEIQPVAHLEAPRADGPSMIEIPLDNSVVEAPLAVSLEFADFGPQQERERAQPRTPPELIPVPILSFDPISRPSSASSFSPPSQADTGAHGRASLGSSDGNLAVNVPARPLSARQKDLESLFRAASNVNHRNTQDALATGATDTPKHLQHPMRAFMQRSNSIHMISPIGAVVEQQNVQRMQSMVRRSASGRALVPSESMNTRSFHRARGMSVTFSTPMKTEQIVAAWPVSEPVVPEAEKPAPLERHDSVQSTSSVGSSASSSNSSKGVPPDQQNAPALEKRQMGAAMAMASANYELSHVSAMDRSLFIFLPNNPFRLLCYDVVTSRVFDGTVILFIMLSCGVMVVDASGQNSSSGPLFWINVAVTAVFTLEMFLKLVAHGFLLGNGSYLSDRWNLLDGIIVVVSILTLILSTTTVVFLRTFRALRVLRPLRLVNRNRGLRLAVSTLLQSLPGIRDTGLVAFLFFLVFSMLGVQLFKGTLYSCTNPAITQRAGCIGTWKPNSPSDNSSVPMLWVNVEQNFDNTYRALLTLFEVSTLEMWSQIMYQTIDGVGVDVAPQLNSNPAVGIYFVVFVSLGTFFIANLFVGVLVYHFNSVKLKMDGLIFLSREQQVWIETQRMMINFKLVVRPVRPRDLLGRKCFDLLELKYNDTPVVDVAMGACIAVNVIFMAMAHYGQPAGLDRFLDVSNTFFTAIFLCEAIVKLLAWRLKYFSETWNLFDIFLVLTSILGIILTAVGSGSSLPVNTTVLRILRIFRILRILRLLRSSKSIIVLLETLWFSLPALFNIGAVLVLLFFMYAVLGVQFFGSVVLQDYLTDDANFGSFYRAMMVLFRMTTGENWNGIMHNTMVQPPKCTAGVNCGTSLAPLYFVSFMLISYFVLLNLFIAIILDNFATTIALENSRLNMAELTKFIEAWSLFDSDATYTIPTAQLPRLLKLVGPPLGIAREYTRLELLNKCGAFNIPDHYGRIHFIETVIPLARLVMNVHLTEEEIEDQEEEWRLAFQHDLPVVRYRDRRVVVEQYFAATYIAAAYRRSKAREAYRHMLALRERVKLEQERQELVRALERGEIEPDLHSEIEIHHSGALSLTRSAPNVESGDSLTITDLETNYPPPFVPQLPSSTQGGDFFPLGPHIPAEAETRGSVSSGSIASSPRAMSINGSPVPSRANSSSKPLRQIPNPPPELSPLNELTRVVSRAGFPPLKSIAEARKCSGINPLAGRPRGLQDSLTKENSQWAVIEANQSLTRLQTPSTHPVPSVARGTPPRNDFALASCLPEASRENSGISMDSLSSGPNKLRQSLQAQPIHIGTSLTVNTETFISLGEAMAVKSDTSVLGSGSASITGASITVNQPIIVTNNFYFSPSPSGEAILPSGKSSNLTGARRPASTP